MKILNFLPEHLNEIIEIEKECFPEKSQLSKDYLLFLWRKFPEGFLVAKEEEKILGYGICQKEGKEGVIFSLAVKPKYQGRGIGSKILERLIETLKKEKIEKISLHARKKNEKAINFYQKFGFKIKKEVENYYSDGETAYLMELIISS